MKEGHMETYEKALAGMGEMVWSLADPLKDFKKATYHKTFEKLAEQNEEILKAAERAYQQSEDKEAVISGLSAAFIKPIVDTIACIAAERKKENRLLDFNFLVAAYLIPVILEYKGDSSDPLADRILADYKAAFPKTNLKKAKYKDIDSGFRKKLCYITTAVCESLGKPDDCYELNLFRSYRDNYLLDQDDGERLVMEYYNIAPSIVKAIDKRADSARIWSDIWEEYLKPCVRLIEAQDNEGCKERYIEMVHYLRENWLKQSQHSRVALAEEAAV